MDNGAALSAHWQLCQLLYLYITDKMCLIKALGDRALTQKRPQNILRALGVHQNVYWSSLLLFSSSLSSSMNEPISLN